MPGDNRNARRLIEIESPRPSNSANVIDVPDGSSSGGSEGPTKLSRVRSRPTREDTSSRVLLAAIEVFQTSGIAAASVEEIVKAAGLTRGAFYSSFANKDEIVVALLKQHVRQAIGRNQKLAECYFDPGSYPAALASDEARDLVALGRLPMLNFELMLYAIRSPEHRPNVSSLLQSLRITVGQIVVSTMRSAGVTRELDALEIGSLLVALEDGFDPSSPDRSGANPNKRIPNRPQPTSAASTRRTEDPPDRYVCIWGGNTSVLSSQNPTQYVHVVVWTAFAILCSRVWTSSQECDCR
jgi:AcrR family transcriptional regulator